MYDLPVIDHPNAAAAFNEDDERVEWHDRALWFVREKRDSAADQIPEWEELRELASQIKSHTLSKLDTYLTEFEARAAANGVQVHWARDADEHNAIVHSILDEREARFVVKSKSMLTEECGLNPYLEEHGIGVVDTDLGERIVQLSEDAPSHIVMPAIHFRKEQVSELFHEKLDTIAGSVDPTYLVQAACRSLRADFVQADAAVTGVNFAVAESGGIVVCTNEGNADLGVHLAPLHIACMGIEKIIPTFDDLAVFLRLLARSATGQPITVYTSHFHRPRPDQEMHIVIVDNGRSRHLSSAEFQNALKCIRCGACMNTCPVYRRSGGHSYGYTIPGPIGSILAPERDPGAHASLPFASTLCGSCSDVCPVKIDIHEQLYGWRQALARDRRLAREKGWMMRVAGFVFARPALYRFVGSMARRMLKLLPRKVIYAKANVWGRSRELPEPPQESFREWFAVNGANTGRSSDSTRHAE